MKRAIVLALVLVVCAVHSAGAHDDHHAPAATEGSLGPVELSEASRQRLGIETMQASPGTVERVTRCYGSVESVPNKVFWASSRVAGRVVRVHAESGKQVEVGEVLAEVESRSVSSRPIVVKIRSRIAGTVVERSVSVGDPVEPENVLYRVTDLSRVLVRCDLFEMDAARVALGQSARVWSATSRVDQIEGTVARIAGALDRDSATLPVWIGVDNLAGVLRPGMSAYADIVTQRSESAVAVPRSAILGAAGNLFVFLDRGAGLFAGVPIGLGLRGQDIVEVTSGVLPGDLVVTVGAYELQFSESSEDSHDDHDDHGDHGEAHDHHGDEENDHGDDHDDHDDHDDEGDDGVHLSDLAQANIGLRTEAVGYRELERTVECVGTVAPAPGSLHRISTRTSGRVSAVLVLEGETVTKGQVLAEVETAAIADPPPVVKVLATRSGVVSEAHVFLGEPVTPTKAMFSLASFDELVVSCHVPESATAEIAAGQEVKIAYEAVRGRVFDGKVAYLDGELHRETGSLHVYLDFNNPGGLMLPNMRVRGYIRVARGDRVAAVNKQALLRSEDGSTEVFLRSGDRFMRKKVEVGRSDADFAEVLEGLLPGDTVVIEGADALRFASDSPSEPGR